MRPQALPLFKAKVPGTGKLDIDLIEEVAGPNWSKFLPMLDRFITLKVNSDLKQITHPFQSRLTQMAAQLTPNGRLLNKYSSNNSTINHGIDVEKLANDARLPNDPDYARNLFRALTNRNYDIRIIEGLAEAKKTDRMIPYCAELIEMDGLIGLLHASKAANENFQTIIQDESIIEALKKSVRDKQDARAALVLADKMLREYSGKSLTDDDRNQLAYLQQLIESSKTLMAYDPAFKLGKLRATPSAQIDTDLYQASPALEKIMGQAPKIFRRMRVKTGQSFIKNNQETTFAEIYQNLRGRDISTLFGTHQSVPLTIEYLLQLAECAILVKTLDTNQKHQGLVEYIAEILGRHTKANTSHVVANLQYPASQNNPSDELKASLKDESVRQQGYSRKINLGDEVWVQQITRGQAELLLISSPSGYVELDNAFLEELRTSIQKPGQDSPTLDEYISAIKSLASFKQYSCDIEAGLNNQRIARELISSMGYSRCPALINSRTFGADSETIIPQLQRQFLEAHPYDSKEIESLIRELIKTNDGNYGREIQSRLFHLLIKSPTPTPEKAIEDLGQGIIFNNIENELTYEDLKDLVTATQEHYPQRLREQGYQELNQEEYKELLDHELNYLLSSWATALPKSATAESCHKIFARKLSSSMLFHAKSRKPELDVNRVKATTEFQIRGLLKQDEFIRATIDQQIATITGIVNKLGST